MSILNHHSNCNNSKKKSLLPNQQLQDCSSSKSEASHITISSSSVDCQSQRTFNGSSFSSYEASSGSLGVKHSNGASLKLNVRKDRSKANPIRGSTGWISIKARTSEVNSREMAKKRRLSENVHTDLSNGGDDPFAFDAIDQEPSNWDIFGPKRKSPQKRAKRSNREVLDDPESCQPEDIYQSGATSDSKAVDESNLLEDCLLASVKVMDHVSFRSFLSWFTSITLVAWQCLPIVMIFIYKLSLITVLLFYSSPCVNLYIHTDPQFLLVIQNSNVNHFCQMLVFCFKFT